MRAYREMWRGLDSCTQWRLECLVYVLRGQGYPEENIGKDVVNMLDWMQPWRMSDGALKRRWLARTRR